MTTCSSSAGRRLGNWLGARKDEPWFAEHLDALPAAYFSATSPQQAAADLLLLHALCRSETEGDGGGCREEPLANGERPPDNLLPPSRPGEEQREGKGARVLAAAHYQPETAVVQCTIATSEQVAAGIFHRLTGALSSLGLQIRSAQIHTLPDGLVLDRFWVHDPDFAGEPPAERLEQIERSLIGSLENPSAEPPTFRRIWQAGSHRRVRVPGVPTRVQIDNSTSSGLTIIDVFTHDRPGLLYAVTRTLFELELSVARAKIGTFLDQVVDVFYVTDRQNRKIRDEGRLDEIRRRLVDVIESAGQV